MEPHRWRYKKVEKIRNKPRLLANYIHTYKHTREAVTTSVRHSGAPLLENPRNARHNAFLIANSTIGSQETTRGAPSAEKNLERRPGSTKMASFFRLAGLSPRIDVSTLLFYHPVGGAHRSTRNRYSPSCCCSSGRARRTRRYGKRETTRWKRRWRWTVKG